VIRDRLVKVFRVDNTNTTNNYDIVYGVLDMTLCNVVITLFY